MDHDSYDVLVIGAGIVGLATAMTLAKKQRCLVAVIDAEPEVAQHQTGHNSGVIHSGLYYRPGSLKARNCVEGRRRLIRFCDEEGIRYELCGKLVIATEASELPRLHDLEDRGRENGISGLERIAAERISDYEPHARGVEALWVPETGIVDYVEVAKAYARHIDAWDGQVLLGCRLNGLRIRSDEVIAETTRGPLRARALINCAGLQCDRVARMAGLRPKIRIVPFRGDYFDLSNGSRELLQNLIYPVPDPRFPFLGVHLTRRLDGSVEAGPNAVLALRREGYERPRFDLKDAASSLLYPGMWLLGARYWRIAASEFLRGGSPKRFAKALQKFVPEITSDDLSSGGCGIRAQALSPSGALLDDFVIERGNKSLHVLNAPSPGATASLCIAESLANMAAEQFELGARGE